MNRIERIKQMEEYLNQSARAVSGLSEALEAYEAIQKSYRKLSDYYGSVRWMEDYEADEAGLLPPDLNRGVLSEDTVYNLIIDNRSLMVRMLKLAADALEKNIL